MLGMSFLSFLTLTIIGAVVAAVYHWVLHINVFEKPGDAFGKLIVGWIGAWLGSPVLGHWLWKFENIYLAPALLGAIAAVHMTVLGVKVFAPVSRTMSATPEQVPRVKAAGKAD